MATQSERLSALATAIGNDVQLILENQGDLTTLTTTAKDSLVSAMNELSGLIGAAGFGSEEIGNPDTDLLAIYNAAKA